MNRLARYVLVQYLKALGVSLAVFTGVLLLMTVARLDTEAERYATDMLTLLKGLPGFLPSFLCFSLPISFLAAGVLVFSSLEGTGQIVAMRASGAHLGRIVLPVLVLATLAVAPMLLLVDAGIRVGYGSMRRLILNSGRDVLARRMSTGKTLRSKGGGRCFLIHRFPPGADADPLAIVAFEGGAPAELVLARDHRLSLGSKVEEGRGWDVLEFRLQKWLNTTRPGEVMLADSGRLQILLPSAAEKRGIFGLQDWAQGLSQNLYKAGRLEARCEELAEAFPEAALDAACAEAAGALEGLKRRPRELVAKLSRSAFELRRVRTEIDRKLSLAFAPFVMALLGLPLGLWLGRSSRLVALAATAVVIAFVYYPLSVAGQGLAVSGALPAGPAVWATPVGLAAAGAVWLNRLL